MYTALCLVVIDLTRRHLYATGAPRRPRALLEPVVALRALGAALAAARSPRRPFHPGTRRRRLLSVFIHVKRKFCFIGVLFLCLLYVC